MTSFKRKLYDRSHRKGFYSPMRNRDGNVQLKYGRHTMLACFALKDNDAEDAQAQIEETLAAINNAIKTLEG